MSPGETFNEREDRLKYVKRMKGGGEVEKVDWGTAEMRAFAQCDWAPMRRSNCNQNGRFRNRLVQPLVDHPLLPAEPRSFDSRGSKRSKPQTAARSQP